MYAAILFCSALLAADADAVPLRVVNTLEEPVHVKFRVVGKQDWLKDELALDAAKTKTIELPKADQYEVLVRDVNNKDVPVGSWDFGKLLAKDAKAELHLVESRQNPARPAVKTPKEVAAPLEYAPAIFAPRQAFAVQIAQPAAAGATASGAAGRFELAVYSQQKYFLIGEFINGKSEKKSDPTNSDPPVVTAPSGIPAPQSQPYIIHPIRRR